MSSRWLPLCTVLGFSLACGGGWERAPVELATTIDTPPGMIATAIALDAEHDRLVVAFGSAFGAPRMTHEVRFLALSDGRELRPALQGDGHVESIAIAADGTFAALGGILPEVVLHPLGEGEALARLPCGRCEVALDPEGARLGVFRFEGPAALQVIRTTDLTVACDLAPDFLALPDHAIPHGGGLAFSDDGLELGVVARHGSFASYDLATCARRHTVRLDIGVYDQVAVSPDGTRWAVSGDGGNAWVLDRATGAVTATWNGIGGDIEIAPLAWANDEELWLSERDNRLSLVAPSHEAVRLVSTSPADPRRPDGPKPSDYLDDVHLIAADGPWVGVGRYVAESPVRVYRWP